MILEEKKSEIVNAMRSKTVILMRSHLIDSRISMILEKSSWNGLDSFIE